MFKFKNSLIAMGGLATIALAAPLLMPLIGFGSNAVGGNAPSIPTQNVNVVNAPTVNAQQSGTWNVGINGTPTVNVADAQTLLVYDETLNISPLQYGLFPILDTSSFKEIRVLVTGENNQYSVFPRLVDPKDTADVLALDNLNTNNSIQSTAIYDLPGRLFDFMAINESAAPQHIRIQVYGRGN